MQVKKYRRKPNCVVHAQNSLADRFGGEALLIFWAFRYFMVRRSIHAASFAATLALCVDRLPKHIQDMMRDEIQRGLQNKYDIPDCMHREWRPVLGRLIELHEDRNAQYRNRMRPLNFDDIQHDESCEGTSSDSRFRTERR